MAAPNTVYVTGIATSTSDEEVQRFFIFCGKIDDVKYTVEGDKKSAAITFAYPTAAKTALMLNNTQIGGNQIQITSEAAASDDVPHLDASPKERNTDELTQEEKPRSRIFAEYLAQGYVVGDVALQKAIDIDQKHGVLKRFMATLTGLDNKYHAVDKAKAADESYHISQRATSLWSGLGSYFEKATSTPTGRRLVGFYTEGSKQVQDIHVEARRLADLKKGQYGGSAYKASGLERVFGKETSAGDTSTAAAAAAAAAAPAEAAPAAEPTEASSKKE